MIKKRVKTKADERRLGRILAAAEEAIKEDDEPALQKVSRRACKLGFRRQLSEVLARYHCPLDACFINEA